MGWNKPSVASTPLPTPKRKPTALRGAVAGFIVVAVAAVVAFVLLSGGDAKPKAKSAKKPAAIKEVKPVVAPKETPKEEAAPEPAKPLMRPRIEYCAGKVTTNWVAVSTNKVRRAKKVFGTMTETLLATLFSLKLGDMPPPMPRIPQREMKNIASILVNDNPITEADDERSAAMKETVARAKKAYKDFIRQGGDPDEFLPYYWMEYQNAGRQYSDAKKSVYALARETPELGEAYRQKVNAVLREKGIKEVEFMPGLQARVDEAAGAAPVLQPQPPSSKPTAK